MKDPAVSVRLRQDLLSFLFIMSIHCFRCRVCPSWLFIASVHCVYPLRLSVVSAPLTRDAPPVRYTCSPGALASVVTKLAIADAQTTPVSTSAAFPMQRIIRLPTLVYSMEKRKLLPFIGFR